MLQCVDAADGSLVGGAALQVDRIGRGPASLERVRCLGQGELAPDHLDVVAVAGREQEVCRRVIGWLRRPGARVVDLDGLAATGHLAGALAPSEIDRTGAPWTPLPADPAEYLADRPGKLRSTISRSRKRFDKVGASVRRVPAEEADRALDTLASLHDDRWAEASGFLAAWDRFRAAAHDGMASGAVVIHELRAADGRVVATELDLVSGDRLAFYQAGRDTDRDWRGSGSVLKAAIIDWACSRGSGRVRPAPGGRGLQGGLGPGAPRTGPGPLRCGPGRPLRGGRRRGLAPGPARAGPDQGDGSAPHLLHQLHDLLPRRREDGRRQQATHGPGDGDGDERHEAGVGGEADRERTCRDPGRDHQTRQQAGGRRSGRWPR